MLTGIDNGKLETFLRAKQVAALLSIGKSTFLAWVKAGKAPPGIRLGSRITVWRASEVMALVASLGEQSRQM